MKAAFGELSFIAVCHASRFMRPTRAAGVTGMATAAHGKVIDNQQMKLVECVSPTMRKSNDVLVNGHEYTILMT